MSFPTNTVRLIYKDLLKGDKCEEEKQILYSQINLYKNKVKMLHIFINKIDS
jgi:hypothetical protein